MKKPSKPLRRRRKASPMGLILVVIASLMLVGLLVVLYMAIMSPDKPEVPTVEEAPASISDTASPAVQEAPKAVAAPALGTAPEVNLAPLWLDDWQRVDRPLTTFSKDFPLRLVDVDLPPGPDGTAVFNATLEITSETPLREAMITLMLLRREGRGPTMSIFAQREIPLVLLGRKTVDNDTVYKLSVPIPAEFLAELQEVDWSISHLEAIPNGLFLREFQVQYLPDRNIPRLTVSARNLADVPLSHIVFAVRALDEQDHIVGQWRYRHPGVVAPGEAVRFNAIIGSPIPATIRSWTVDGAGEGLVPPRPGSAAALP